MIKTCLRSISVVLAIGGLLPVTLKAAQFIETGGQVVIEAEHYTGKVDAGGHSFVVVPDEALFSARGTNATYLNARAGRSLQNQPNSGQNKGSDPALVGTAPYVDYAVKITTVGEYQLYVRAIGWDGDGTTDSVSAEILSNGKRLPSPNPGWYRYGGFLPGVLPLDFSQLRNNPTSSTPVGWTGYAAPEHVDGTDGDVPAVYTISTPGTYTIRFSQREDGTSIDALILQLSSMDPPASPGPEESRVEGFLILSDPVSVRSGPGATATLTVKVSESTAAAYQWQKAPPNSTTFSPIPGAVLASYTTSALLQSDSATSYRVVVTSGANVLTSRPARIISASGQFIETAGQAVIEAEHFTAKADGTTHPFVLVPDEAPFTAGGPTNFLSARGDRFMQVQPDDGLNKGNDASLVGAAPYLDYTVKITTVGEYQLYLRVLGFDGGGSDSVYAEILSNGKRLPAPNPGWYRYGGLLPAVLPMDFSQLRNKPTDATPMGWTGYAAPEHVDGTDSDVPAVFKIDAAGSYTIRISQREDGTCLDALILQLSSMDPPAADAGPYESRFEPAAVTVLPQPMISFQQAGNKLTIIWTNGGSLQEAASVSGLWSSVASGGTFSTTMAQSMRFYRVAR